jgi:hypothetical protein
MAQNQDRLSLAGPMQTRDHIPLLRGIRRNEHRHVQWREADVQQPLRHCLGRNRRVARRIGGVDLDQLLEDFAGSRAAEFASPEQAYGQKECESTHESPFSDSLRIRAPA